MPRTQCLILSLLFVSTSILTAQTASPFSVEAYRQFLTANGSIGPEGLRSLHDAGRFVESIGTDASSGSYYDSIGTHFSLTADERDLLRTHGFVVSERLSRESFGWAFAEIFHADLPVFISADAILHSMHMSYDVILKRVEEGSLIPETDSLLSAMHNFLPILNERYGSVSGMQSSLRDVDIYITVARTLLGATASPFYPENWTVVSSVLAHIDALAPADIALFSSAKRTIDFSQFKVRGHYAESILLGNYFRSMMWMGRTEIYLTSPIVDGAPTQFSEDIRRQVIDAFLLLEAVEGSGSRDRHERIDRTIRLFVGESDNVTCADLASLRDLAGIDSLTSILDSSVLANLHTTLANQSYAGQRILSQIIISDPFQPEQVVYPSAFLLFGQRFVIDSYVTASVVYDRIVWEGTNPTRMLPSSLDVLFALGNDGAAQLLEPELESYHYAPNLAALRYLVDAYDASFWSSTLYNGWLNSIRALNPPPDRSVLPSFMQTAAWWQHKMNTQLASWAQLRHDNLLYAKQSYSGGTICSYPESYVEPVPEFFRAVADYAEEGAAKLMDLGFASALSYFHRLGEVADTLGMIAQKTLDGVSYTEAEREFLRGMLVPPSGECGSPYRGWYATLFYSPFEADMFRPDLVIADVHTAPTDEFGSPVGWVLHAGTGPVNIAVISATLPDGQLCTFAGPVLSYYEYLGTGFQRLSDKEWHSIVPAPPSSRPSFTNLYLADATGNKKPDAARLLTTVKGLDGQASLPLSLSLDQNYPNPFNPTTIFQFSAPGDGNARLTIFDLLGREVAVVFNGRVKGGTSYRAVFDAGDLSGGTYFAALTWNDERMIRRMLLVR